MDAPSLLLFRRELRGLLRAHRSFWFLAAVVALTSLLPLAAWPRQGAAAAGRNIESLSSALIAQLAAALLAIAPTVASSIAGERERGTYDLLFTTRLAPTAILLSKVAVPVAYLCLILAAAAPPICALYLLGGTKPRNVTEAYLVLLSSIAMSTLVCVAQSMRSRNTAQATLRGLLWTGMWNLGMLMLPYLLLRLGSRLLRSGTRFVTSNMKDEASAGCLILLFVITSPIAIGLVLALSPMAFHVIRALGPTLSPFTALRQALEGREDELGWVGFAFYAGIVSLGYLRFILESSARPDSASPFVQTAAVGPGASGQSGGGRRIATPRSAFTRELLHLARRDWPVARNPILVRELRTQFHSGQLYHFVVLIVSLIAGPIWGAGAGIAGIAAPAIVLAALCLPAVGATAFTRETEQGNLDFLRGTLATPREIVTGKMLAVLTSAVGMLAGPLCIYALLFVLYWPIAEDLRWNTAASAAAFAVLVATVLSLSAGSLLVSVVSPSSTGALLVAYGMAFAYYLLPPMLEVFLRSDLADFASSFQPFALLRALQKSHPGEFPTTSLAVLLALHVGAACAAFAAACRWVSSRRMREP